MGEETEKEGKDCSQVWGMLEWLGKFKLCYCTCSGIVISTKKTIGKKSPLKKHLGYNSLQGF